MKILSVSDIVITTLLETNNGKPFLPGIDLIISCGDLPPEYLTALRGRYNVPLYYVLGNHDLRYATSPPVGCRCLHRQLIVHEGIRVAGFSGSRWYNGNINQYTERQMASFIRGMWFQLWRKGVDLVVTHAPPRYVNDAEDPCHKGFHAYHKLLQRHHPRYLIHGHIHRLFTTDTERITTFGTTRIINSYGYHTFKI